MGEHVRSLRDSVGAILANALGLLIMFHGRFQIDPAEVHGKAVEPVKGSAKHTLRNVVDMHPYGLGAR